MIRRFRLEQKSYYEKLIIAQRIAEMLSKFLDGRLTSVAIGAEQGGIQEWDDVVIMHSENDREHLQIKRQTTDFCDKNADKSKISARKKSGNLGVKEPSDSVLDKAFKSLANLLDSGKLDSTPARTFQLTLVGAHIKIKKDLTINHLDEFCALCRKDGLDLHELSKRQDGPTQRVYLWLTTWCGFKDWEHIRNTLSRVTVVCAGNEANLEQRVHESLGRHFKNPATMLKQLIAYITTNTSDVTALSCTTILQEFYCELRTDYRTWAQYHSCTDVVTGSVNWSFFGTHDLKGVTSEVATGIVKHMWADTPGNRQLRIYANYKPPYREDPTLSSSIMRMALHLTHGGQCLMLGESSWRAGAKTEVGFTLGCAENDLNNLPWFENSECLDSAVKNEYKNLSETRAAAQALQRAMDEIVWQRVVKSVTQKVNTISDDTLADAVDKVWQSWQINFNSKLDCRRRFFEDLLYPATEGKLAKQALRLGPQTTELLAAALETLLLVAVGLADTDIDWANFPVCDDVFSIALKYWSGPSGKISEVRELSDDRLITLTGPSPSPIVILSGVNASPSQLQDKGMADDIESSTSMAAERQPELLVTKFRVFQHFREGTLTSVQQHFMKQWKDRHIARQAAIVATSEGV